MINIYTAKILKPLALFLVLFLTLPCFGQKDIDVVVVDEETQRPISNVNIKIKGTSKGFTSNRFGMFKIKVNTNLKSTDTLIFSHINFYPKNIAVQRIIDSENKIHLLKNPFILDEALLSGKNKKNSTHLNYRTFATMPKSLSNFDAFISKGKIYIIGGKEFNESNAWSETLSQARIIETGTGKGILEELKNGYLNSDWKSYNNKIYEFNIEDKKWSINKNKTIKRAFHKVEVFNNKAYIIGGRSLSKNKRLEYLENRIEIFDLNSDTIIIDKVNPHTASSFATFLYKDNIVCIGGSTKIKKNDYKDFRREVNYQNLTNGIWYKIGNMPIPKETQGILIDDNAYLIGGFEDKPSKNIESFNLVTGKWKKEGELFKSMGNPAIAKHKNTIFIFDDGIFLTYNTKSNRLNKYSINLFLKGSKLLINDKTIFILGGIKSNDFSEFSTKRIYALSLNEFKKTQQIESKIVNK